MRKISDYARPSGVTSQNSVQRLES